MPETVEYRRALLPALLMLSFSVAFVGVGVWMLYAVVFQNSADPHDSLGVAATNLHHHHEEPSERRESTAGTQAGRLSQEQTG